MERLGPVGVSVGGVLQNEELLSLPLGKRIRRCDLEHLVAHAAIEDDHDLAAPVLLVEGR